MPFAVEVACGQVIVSHLAYLRVALNLGYMIVSGKTIDVCPIAGRFFCSDRTDLLEPLKAGPLRVEAHSEQVSQGGSRHRQPIYLTFQFS